MSTTTMRGVLKAALVLCVLAAFWNGACATDPVDPVPPQPPPGQPPATLTLSENKGTLMPGTYSATIPITSSVATNSPQIR